jgi:hypothetical protein
MKFDIFLVSAPKDYSKIHFVLEGIFANVPGFDNVYLCTPHQLSEEFVASLHFLIHYRTDRQVLKAYPQRWRHRPSWVYQQFIKLFQNETKNDYYFVVDCDTIINKVLPMFVSHNGGIKSAVAGSYGGTSPIWYTSWEQNNRPYYEFQEKMFGYGRVYNHSFLADMGFYSKSMVREMLESYNYTVESFLAKSYKIVNQHCYPSEADVYMSYVYKHHPDKYVIKNIESKCDAKHHDNPLHQVWSEEDIRQHVNSMRFTNYQTFAIHSWCNRSHNSWGK